MYIRSLDISDLRAVQRGHIDLLYPRRERDKPFKDLTSWPPRLDNVNLLLGVNGAGKSTMLDAAALAILSPIIAQSGYRPYYLMRRMSKGRSAKRASINAELIIHEQDGIKSRDRKGRQHHVKTIVLKRGDIERVQGADENNPIYEGMFSDASPAFLLVGYGATRRVEDISAPDASSRGKSRHVRYERVASLFEEHFTLRPLASWLPQWKSRNPGRFTQVVGLINRLSREGVRFTGQLENGEYLFEVKEAKLPFSALSDGYKAFIGWVCDLLYHVCMGCPPGKKLVDNCGVVLVDEIDLHIHPEWQRTIIPTLAQTLPNLQFIFTSHSPLVVGTLERSNIIHVEADDAGRPVLQRPDEEVYGLSADQILRSEIFGLESTRDPAFKEHLDSLTRKAAAGDRKAAMQFMRQTARGKAAIVESRMPPRPPAWVQKLAAKNAKR
jgi:hypothetical protein